MILNMQPVAHVHPVAIDRQIAAMERMRAHRLLFGYSTCYHRYNTESVGSDEFVDENTLTVNINRLRKTLRDAGLPDAIRTHKGEGYSLDA